jgi:hypothetical protein
MSEFGSWGLPRPSRARSAQNGDPWWWTTGERFRRPAGIQHRFQEQRLDRIWDDVDALADATQWQQFAAFAGQVRELRRHPSIRGYVVTEFTDVFWEANGLLDVNRGPKIFHDRVAELNAPDVLVVDLPRFDLWAGERISCDALISSFSDSLDASDDGEGQLTWQIRLSGRVTTGAPVVFGRWPGFDTRVVARLELDVPDVTQERRGELIVTATRSSGRARAVYRTPITVIPKARRRSAVPRRIRVVDPVDLWSIAARITELGHQLTTARDAELIVASHLDRGVLAEVDDGASLLLLARSADSIDSGVSLSRSFTVRSRGSQADLPWNGDYSSVFAWALPGIVPGLPDGGLLGDAEAEIYPDHVLDGGNPAAWVDIAGAGLFSGWVHSPAALLAEFAQTRGEVMLTTLRLSPEGGPVATALLEALIQRLAGA